MKRIVSFIFAALLVAGCGVALAHRPDPPPRPLTIKIELCHHVNGSHPYNLIEVSINSVAKAQSVDGHGTHELDIIPSFTYGSFSYPGQGDQAILANDCEIPVPTPTPEVTPTPTPVPTPEPTPTPEITPRPTPESTPTPVVTPSPTPTLDPCGNGCNVPTPEPPVDCEKTDCNFPPTPAPATLPPTSTEG